MREDRILQYYKLLTFLRMLQRRSTSRFTLDWKKTHRNVQKSLEWYCTKNSRSEFNSDIKIIVYSFYAFVIQNEENDNELLIIFIFKEVQFTIYFCDLVEYRKRFQRIVGGWRCDTYGVFWGPRG